MGLARILGVCAAVLFTASIGAAEIIDLGPSDYRNWGTGANSHTASGLRSSTGQAVCMPPLNTTLNVTRNAVIPYGSLANGMRNFTRITPGGAAASAAVTGLFLAMDWYFDQEKGEWVKESIETVGPDVPTGEWRAGGGWMSGATGLIWPTKEAACEGLIPAYLADTSAVWSYRTTELYNNRWNCLAYRNGQPYGNRMGTVINSAPSCPEGWDYNVIEGTCTRLGSESLGASDFNELAGYLPSADPNTVGRAGSDTQRKIGNPLPGYQDQTITGPSSVSGPETTSTSTDPVTGDTIVTNTSTQTNISYGPTTITTTNTTTTTTYQNGQETGTTVTTETPGELPVESGGGASGDWPGFCEWATVVCDWLNWTQEEPPPDEPLPAVIDDDFFEEKNISFGAKSCPPDHEISLAPFLETTVGVSFQPLCDFAALIYYMVMAASYIIAAYISIGVARNA